MLCLPSVHPVTDVYAVSVQVRVHVSQYEDLVSLRYGLQGLGKLCPVFRLLFQESFLVLWLGGSGSWGPSKLIANQDICARVGFKPNMQEAARNEVPMLDFGFREGVLIDEHQETSFRLRPSTMNSKVLGSGVLLGSLPTCLLDSNQI